jgi:hypothetical protein
VSSGSPSTSAGATGVVEVDPIITCIDCGGRAHLISHPPGEDDAGGWQPGDLVVYRCEDCMDRWDLIIPDPDDDDATAESDDSEPL